MNLNQDTIYDALTDIKFKQAVAECKKCSLHKTRHQVVFGAGCSTAPLMIIGEAPGEKEDMQGEPFIGRSGQLLTTLLAEAGIDRQRDCFIANTVKCRPPKNRNPLKKEIDACNSFLIKQIKLIKPKVILLCGSPSLKTVLGNKHKITAVRGTWFERDVDYMQAPINIMPIFHPAYLLRYGSKKEGAPLWLTRKDLKKVKQYLELVKIT